MKGKGKFTRWVAIVALTVTAISLEGCSPAGNNAPDYSVQPQVIAVVGDFGSGRAAESRVSKMVAKWNPSVVVTAGDNNYTKKSYERMVKKYYPQPLVAATGNHDYLVGINRFDSFFNKDSQSRNYVYHAASGADFFILDSTAGLESKTIRNQQESWLTQQLAISNANFKIVVLHHPPYSSSKHGSTKVYQWPYAEMGADLVISGHDHSYERIERWSGIYIVDGTGGAKLYKCKPKLVYGSQGCDDKHYGALFLYINGYQLRGIFRDTNGRALDTFDVFK
ncbi:MAG: metallophosphoesterase family protein [Micrococcales bacterium]